MDYSQYNLESLLSQVETAYFLAKHHYREYKEHNLQVDLDIYDQEQDKRQAIKDEIIKRYSCLEQRV